MCDVEQIVDFFFKWIIWLKHQVTWMVGHYICTAIISFAFDFSLPVSERMAVSVSLTASSPVCWVGNSMPLYPKQIQIVRWHPTNHQHKARSVDLGCNCVVFFCFSPFNLISYKHKPLLLIEGAGMGLNQQDQMVSWEISISNADMWV